MGLNSNDEDDAITNDILATTSSVSAMNDNKNDEAQRLLDKVKQMRMEIAALTGQTVEDVEREAALKKSQQLENEERFRINRQQQQQQQQQQQSSSLQQRQYRIPVPDTVSEQIQQAANAIERAYRDGHIQKQIIRFAFVPIVTSNDIKTNYERDLDHQSVLFVRNDQDWPGGIQQIYREAARPYTERLLQQLRIVSPPTTMKPKRIIQEQTLWDFDGSAVLTASDGDVDSATSSSSTSLIQALIHPNTDNRYFNDIQQMDERLLSKSKKGQRHEKKVDNNNKDDGNEPRNEGVNLIINPFWTNATSWGYNIFAPNAQQRANDIIFKPSAIKNDDDSTNGDTSGYIETYSIVTKTVRGEDCIAIKAYPYDWQLYAYLEELDDRRYYGPSTTTIHLGSSVTEPTITDFVQLLSNRTEFQYSKNMRLMQRTMNK
jgi:hypothetical protein